MSRKPLQAEELTPELTRRYRRELQDCLRRLKSIRRDMDSPSLQRTAHEFWRKSPGLDAGLSPAAARRIKRACRKQN